MLLAGLLAPRAKRSVRRASMGAAGFEWPLRRGFPRRCRIAAAWAEGSRDHLLLGSGHPLLRPDVLGAELLAARDLAHDD